MCYNTLLDTCTVHVPHLHIYFQEFALCFGRKW